MTQFDAIPASSISWLIGATGALIFAVKSFLRYHYSRNELTSYTAWFSLMIGLSLALFSVPSFFTLNPHTLLNIDLVGEAFFYVGLIFEAAIMWCLILRSYWRMRLLTIPVGIIGLAAWLYAIPHARLLVMDNFITGTNPTFTNWATAVLMVGLFVPVGVYFLRQAPRQNGRKAVFTSAVVGMVYLGTGLIAGGFEIITGELMTRTSVIGYDIFFTILLMVALWPRPTGSP
jgi:hypothetical protein